MSKFMDAIVMKLTGRQYASVGKLELLGEIDAKLSMKPIPMETLDEYRIDIQWGFYTRCTQEEKPFVYKQAIRMLKRDLYGDFDNKLILLERALWEQAYKKAQKILSEIHEIIEL